MYVTLREHDEHVKDLCATPANDIRALHRIWPKIEESASQSWKDTFTAAREDRLDDVWEMLRLL